MNLLQLAQRLHRESGRSGVGPALGPASTTTAVSKEHARLFDWLNDAWLELQTRPIDWRWMRKTATIQTVLGQTKYTALDMALTDFWAPRAVSDDYTVKAYLTTEPGNVWDICYLPLDEYRRCHVDQSSSAGQPLDWSVDDDNSLLIGPAPDSALHSIRFEYKQEPIPLVLDADTPAMAVRYHMMLVWRGLIEVGKFDNAPDVLARGQYNYARLESSLMAEYTRPYSFGGPIA